MNLGKQAGQRGPECCLVIVLHRGLELGVDVVQLVGDGVVHPELALAENPDDHEPSPSCGTSETGSPAGRESCGWLYWAGGGSWTGGTYGGACGGGGAYCWAGGWACPACDCPACDCPACDCPACGCPVWEPLGPPGPPSSCLGALALSSPLSRFSSLSTSLFALSISSSDWMSSRRPPPRPSSSAPEAINSSIAPARACIWAVLSSARWIAMPTSPISSEMPENASLIRVCASAAV